MSRPVTDAAVARLQAIVGPSVASSDLRAALFRCRGDENRALDRVLSAPPRATATAAGGRPRSALLVARRAAAAAAAAAVPGVPSASGPTRSPATTRTSPSPASTVPLGRSARRPEPAATAPPQPRPSLSTTDLDSTATEGGATPPVSPPTTAVPGEAITSGGTPISGGSPNPSAAAAPAGALTVNDPAPPPPAGAKSAPPRSAGAKSASTVLTPTGATTSATTAAAAERTAWHAFFRHYYAAAYERMATTAGGGAPDKRMVNKLLARWWRTLSPADRAVWLDASAEAVGGGGVPATGATTAASVPAREEKVAADTAAASAGAVPLASSPKTSRIMETARRASIAGLTSPHAGAEVGAPSSSSKAPKTLETAGRASVGEACAPAPTLLPLPAAGATARAGWPKVLPPATVTGMCTSSCRVLTVGDEVTFSVGGLERTGSDSGGVAGRGRGRGRSRGGGTPDDSTPSRDAGGAHAPLTYPPPLPSSSAAIVRFSVRGSVVGKLPAAVAQPLGLLLTAGLVSVHGAAVATVPPSGGVRFGGRLEMHLSLALHRLAFPAAVGGGVGVAAAAAEAAAATVVAAGAGAGGGGGGGGRGGGGDATAWQGVLVRLLGALGLVDARGYEGATPVSASTAAADEAADAPGVVAEVDREKFYDTVKQLTSETGGDGAAGGGSGSPSRPAALSSAATLARPPRGLTATLRPYQAAGVAWMVARERYGDNATAVAGGDDGDGDGEGDANSDGNGVPSAAAFASVARESGGRGARRRLRLHPLWRAYATADGTPFYVNATSGVVSLDMPAANPDGVRGGIMADEMGLGKTVMTIATILANRVLSADGESFDGVAEEEAEAAAAAASAAAAGAAAAGAAAAPVATAGTPSATGSDGTVKADATGGNVIVQAGAAGDNVKAEEGSAADAPQESMAAATATAVTAGASGGDTKVDADPETDAPLGVTLAASPDVATDVPATATVATPPTVEEPADVAAAVDGSPGTPAGGGTVAMDVDAAADGGNDAAGERSPPPLAAAVSSAAASPGKTGTLSRPATPDAAAAAASSSAAVGQSPPAVGAKRRRGGAAEAPAAAEPAAPAARRRPRRAAANRAGRPTYADVPSSGSDLPTSSDTDADDGSDDGGWTPSSVANGRSDAPSSPAGAMAVSAATFGNDRGGESEEAPLAQPRRWVAAKRTRTGRATRSSSGRVVATDGSDSNAADAPAMIVLCDNSDEGSDGGREGCGRPRPLPSANTSGRSRQWGRGGGGGGVSLGVGLPPSHARSRRRGGTLVVCPLSLLAQWVDELAEHVAPGMLRVVTYYGAKRGARGTEAISLAAADVVVTTYQTLAAEAPLASVDGGGGGSVDGGGRGGGGGSSGNLLLAGGAEMAAATGAAATHAHPPPPLYGVTWTRVVLDEAHTIKSSATRVARAAYLLRASRRWALTGTPIVNALDDVQSLLRFLQAAPWSEPAVWRARIVEPLAAGGAGGGVTAAQATVRRVLRPLMLRRRKSTLDAAGRPIVELPRKDISVVSVALSTAERDFYDALYQRSKTRFDAFVAAGRVFNNYASVLEILLRLRQCCDHPYLVLAAPSKDLAAWKDLNKLAARFVNGGGGTDGGGDAEKGGGKAARERFVRSVLAASRASQPVGGDAASLTAGAGGDGMASPSSPSGTPPVGTPPPPAAAASCPICLDGVEDAVLPPCCHALCRACAAEQLAASGGGADATAACALCRAPFGRCDLTTAPRSSRWAVDVDARWVPSAKISAALAALRTHAATPGAGKAVLFSQWTSCLDLVEVALRKDAEAAAAAGEPPLPRAVRLDGSCSAAARAATLSAFGDPRPGSPGLLLVSLKAGGTGLNLTAANLVLLLDPWWNWAVEAQAVDRACRIGQTRPVRVLRLVVADSVEERMLRVQARKSALVDGAVGSAEERRAARLEDVMMLFS